MGVWAAPGHLGEAGSCGFDDGSFALSLLVFGTRFLFFSFVFKVVCLKHFFKKTTGPENH